MELYLHSSTVAYNFRVLSLTKDRDPSSKKRDENGRTRVNRNTVHLIIRFNYCAVLCLVTLAFGPCGINSKRCRIGAWQLSHVSVKRGRNNGTICLNMTTARARLQSTDITNTATDARLNVVPMWWKQQQYSLLH